MSVLLACAIGRARAARGRYFLAVGHASNLYVGLMAGVVGSLVAGCGTSPEFREDVVEPDADDYEPADENISLRGSWKGAGQQSDGTSWDMRLTISSEHAGRCATIEYPSSGCSGYWECRQPFDGVQLDAVEHITKGRDRCVDQVDVQLVVERGGRTLSFYAATGDITAQGRLGRD